MFERKIGPNFKNEAQPFVLKMMEVARLAFTSLSRVYGMSPSAPANSFTPK